MSTGDDIYRKASSRMYGLLYRPGMTVRGYVRAGAEGTVRSG
jgi:hypothetical protein